MAKDSANNNDNKATSSGIDWDLINELDAELANVPVDEEAGNLSLNDLIDPNLPAFNTMTPEEHQVALHAYSLPRISPTRAVQPSQVSHEQVGHQQLGTNPGDTDLDVQAGTGNDLLTSNSQVFDHESASAGHMTEPPPQAPYFARPPAPPSTPVESTMHPTSTSVPEPFMLRLASDPPSTELHFPNLSSNPRGNACDTSHQNRNDQASNPLTVAAPHPRPIQQVPSQPAQVVAQSAQVATQPVQVATQLAQVATQPAQVAAQPTQVVQQSGRSSASKYGKLNHAPSENFAFPNTNLTAVEILTFFPQWLKSRDVINRFISNGVSYSLLNYIINSMRSMPGGAMTPNTVLRMMQGSMKNLGFATWTPSTHVSPANWDANSLSVHGFQPPRVTHPSGRRGNANAVPPEIPFWNLADGVQYWPSGADALDLTRMIQHAVADHDRGGNGNWMFPRDYDALLQMVNGPAAIAPAHRDGAAFKRWEGYRGDNSYPRQPVQTQAVPAQPVPAQPSQAQPVQAHPVHAQPAPAHPIQVQPVQPQPVQPQPVQPQPIQPRPSQAEPVQAQLKKLQGQQSTKSQVKQSTMTDENQHSDSVGHAPRIPPRAFLRPQALQSGRPSFQAYTDTYLYFPRQSVTGQSSNGLGRAEAQWGGFAENNFQPSYPRRRETSLGNASGFRNSPSHTMTTNRYGPARGEGHPRSDFTAAISTEGGEQGSPDDSHQKNANQAAAIDPDLAALENDPNAYAAVMKDLKSNPLKGFGDGSDKGADDGK